MFKKKTPVKPAKKHPTPKNEVVEAMDSATVVPSERVPGKFTAIHADGTIDPYAYRSEAEAWESMGIHPEG